MIEEQTPKKLGILYFFGLAPILAWPVCILASALSSTDPEASDEYLFFILGLSILYPLVPIGCFMISIIAARKNRPRLAYGAAVAPVLFYLLVIVIACGVYYITSV